MKKDSILLIIFRVFLRYRIDWTKTKQDWEERVEKKRRTGEVADGDGDAGDGDEAEVVESAEVSDDFGEGRVPIYHRVLWLRRRCDVCVHFCNAGGCCSEPGFHSLTHSLQAFLLKFRFGFCGIVKQVQLGKSLSLFLFWVGPSILQILGPMQPGLWGLKWSIHSLLSLALEAFSHLLLIFHLLHKLKLLSVCFACLSYLILDIE